MAHAHVDVWASPAKVVRNNADEIELTVGAIRLVMLDDTAATLAADILDAIQQRQVAA